MKQRVRLIAPYARCQRCRAARAVVLFRSRAWCVADVVREVAALRGTLLSGTSRKSGGASAASPGAA